MTLEITVVKEKQIVNRQDAAHKITETLTRGNLGERIRCTG